MGRHPTGRIRRGAALIGGLLAAVMAPSALAQELDPSAVPLDKLLEIPRSVQIQSGLVRRGGSTRPEWQLRFDRARDEYERAKLALEEVRAELEELSTGEAWKMSPPGLGGLGGGSQAPSESSLDYKLAQQLRRQRDEVALTERRLKDVEIEANLAGVPEDWRTSDDVSATPPVGR